MTVAPTHYSPAGDNFPLSLIVFAQISKKKKNMAALIVARMVECSHFHVNSLESPRAKRRPQPEISVCYSKGRAAQVTRMTNFDPWYIAKEPANHRRGGLRTPLG